LESVASRWSTNHSIPTPLGHSMAPQHCTWSPCKKEPIYWGFTMYNQL